MNTLPAIERHSPWVWRWGSPLLRLMTGILCLFLFEVTTHGEVATDVGFSHTVEGRVVRISDGDTLTILTSDNKQIRIRLAEIDTPERGQPYATRSQQELSSLVWQKELVIGVVDVDRYGRIVGRIFVGNIDVSAELVRRGAAWVYRQYAKDRLLFDLEAEARTARRGIWALPETDQIPPWEWRRRR